jgi:hypothetical protein
MALYDRLADRPLTVEGWDRRQQARQTPDFERVTTTFVATGDGATGRGEDVTYDAPEHDALRDDPPDLPTGSFAFAEFSAALDDRDLFPVPPERETSRDYRRWAVESAALDLALRQAGTTLGAALDRDYDPVRFVASTRLGDPPTTDRLDAIRATNPDVEFKLDPTPDWDEDLLGDLARVDVRVVDLKGHYEGTDVDTEADAEFYRRIVEAFPDAVVEDPLVTDATRPVVEPAADRVAWDAPIHGLDDLRATPFEPRWLNVKPSRFGTVESVLETVEHCLDAGVSLYGGGQFELGVGREHAQALASLFYPNGPNDLAPPAYNDRDLAGDLPASPLAPGEPEGLGFGA